jgi:sulfite reductase alpha subunit-like flavoprotein
LLHGLKYVVFGLGNRQYEHYNAMGRLVNQRLGEMGATPVYRYGEGDDDGTLEEDFDGWKADMWNGIKADLGLLGTLCRWVWSSSVTDGFGADLVYPTSSRTSEILY